MTESEWVVCREPEEMLRKVLLFSTTRRRKARLLGCAACRRIWEMMGERCREAVEASEQYAAGLIAEVELDCFSRAVVEDLGGFSRDDQETNVARAVVNISSLSLAAPLLSQALDAILSVAPEETDERMAQVAQVHDIFGNPFRAVAFSPEWRTDTARNLAAQMYEARDFSALPVLADALQDAGCDSAEVLDHCRGPGPHVRGCWVVDLVLGKE